MKLKITHYTKCVIMQVNTVVDKFTITNNVLNKYEEKVEYIGIAINDDIKIGIEDFQSCCERFGTYFCYNDLKTINLSEIDIVGKIVSNVNCEKTEVKMRNYDDKSIYFTIFHVLFTDNSILKVELYNDQNGCYPHRVICESPFLTMNDSI